MRTSELCSIWREAATHWPSIWELGGDILFWKLSRRPKASLDGRFDGRWGLGGRAILRCWWPIRRKLKRCWDGLRNETSATSSPLRGLGCKRDEAAAYRLRERRP